MVALEDGGAAYDLDNIKTLCRSRHIAEHRRVPTQEEAAWRELWRQLFQTNSSSLAIGESPPFGAR